jgi:hypothetical protein
MAGQPEWFIENYDGLQQPLTRVIVLMSHMAA